MVAHAVLTCHLCLGIHILHALGLGVGHVLIILRVILVMIGRWINGNIIVLNALMLGAVNHLPAMLVIPLMQLPTPHCPRPRRGPFLPRLLPFPSPSEAPSVTNISSVNVDEPRVPSPTSMPSREHGERGRDTIRVRDGEGEAASTSLTWGGGGGGKSPRPQPDPLEDKSPPSPSQLRLKISSYHHVDDWGVDGEDRAPSPAPSPPQAKRRREERERGMDCTRSPDFQEKSARHRSPPKERPQPHGRDRRTVPARPRCPPVRAQPAGYSRIHWGLIRPYDAHTEFGEHVSRPRDQAFRHNSVANSVWERAEARNRSRVWEPDAPSASYPLPHQHSESFDCPRSWAPQPRTSMIQPLPSDPHHRATQPPRHTEPCDHRAAQYTLDHPARDRLYEAQRPQAPAAAPLDGPTSAYEPSGDYRKRSTPPPARSRNSPAHSISGSDSSDAETRPHWPYSPPRKAPHRADDAFSGHRQRSAAEFPEPPHSHYESKQASTYPSEPQPSTSRYQTYAWPPTPRDFDSSRAESLACTEDEPDYSFSAVVDMIRNFHDIERPTAATPARTVTAFDQMRGLQSSRAPAFHLPTSPLLGGLIDDVNSALARLIEEQTNGFIPFSMKRHRRFYRLASPSLSAPYVVPPSLASLTREKPGDHKHRPVHLPYAVLTGLESALAGIGDTISWLDWWLSTFSGFREALNPSVQANFERIFSSGSKALAFVGSQAVPALANLLLSRRDSLLAEVRSTVPTEELSFLRHSPLPPAAAIFPSTLLDTALNKARAASNDALVHKAMHPTRIPKRPAQGSSRSNSANRSADTSGSSPLTPRQQQTPCSNGQANSQAANRQNKNRNHRWPFSLSTGRSGNSGGKGKGSGKRSN